MHRTVVPSQCGGDQSPDMEAAGTGFESSVLIFTRVRPVPMCITSDPRAFSFLKNIESTVLLAGINEMHFKILPQVFLILDHFCCLVLSFNFT